jgi:hypothetical protein
MKTLLNRYICFWLSLMVLLSSVGLTMSEHICLISGKVMLSYEVKQDPCQKPGKSDCEKATNKPVIKKKCCEFKLDHQKLEAATAHKLSHYTFSWITPQPAFLPVFPTIFRSLPEPALHYADSSPPLYGKNLLYSLHLLRV